MLSGVLLWASYPPVSRADSAWMALAPLFLVVRHSRPRAAAGWGWVCGAVFWTLTLGWFPAIVKNGGPWPLVLLGQVGLAAWCALFLGLFAYAAARVWGWAGEAPGWRRLAAAALEAALWAGAEYARGRLFSGFAWNFLGVSQVGNVALIQVASVAGVYGVSALLVLANGAVTGLLERTAAPFVARVSGQPLGRLPFAARLARSAESALPLTVVLACWLWGMARVEAWRKAEPGVPRWRVALVQPNTPCVFEVDDGVAQEQRELLVGLTRHAGETAPDLTVWPETAVLGSVPYQAETMRVIREGAAAAGGGALLTGTLEIARVPAGRAAPEGLCFYNAAWLFSGSGEVLGRYQKRHLVPFGEYIPLDKVFPALQRLAPTGVSCTPGGGPGVLRLARGPGRELCLGPLICFEDTVPGLSREAVRAGARLLVLMTNDAWFSGSVEPLQHLEQSVFRAVENGVPLVRAANSGVSCVVDAVGRVARYESAGALTDFSGFYVTQVAVPERPLPAPYGRYGDWTLAIPGCLAAVALAGAGLAGRVRRRWGRA